MVSGAMTDPKGDRSLSPSQQKDPDAARKYIYGQHPLGRIGTIEECGHLAAFLASDDAGFITGAVFDIDGGVTLGY